ncbi:hypothetical protein [Flavisolibacter nicotianae]|uniref:hypothetical protein n=1 Tax=Flavisolibacter nicotianae TaxID=2364882 RepID=UPI0013C46676|nr:hypothetical protein [Flavisolibacter nicotianae]
MSATIFLLCARTGGGKPLWFVVDSKWYLACPVCRLPELPDGLVKDFNVVSDHLDLLRTTGA